MTGLDDNGDGGEGDDEAEIKVYAPKLETRASEGHGERRWEAGAQTPGEGDDGVGGSSRGEGSAFIHSAVIWDALHAASRENRV